MGKSIYFRCLVWFVLRLSPTFLVLFDTDLKNYNKKKRTKETERKKPTKNISKFNKIKKRK